MFTVQLWDLARLQPERTIGRAASLEVASAIYAAAVLAHPHRRVVLLRGAEVMKSTG